MAKHASGDMRFVRMNHVFTRNMVDLYRNGQPTSQAQNSFLQAEMRATNNKYIPQIPPFPLTKGFSSPCTAFPSYIFIRDAKLQYWVWRCHGVMGLPCKHTSDPKQEVLVCPKHTTPGVPMSRAFSQRLSIAERVKNILSRICSYLELLFIQRGNKTFRALDQCKKGQYKLQQLYIN